MAHYRWNREDYATAYDAAAMHIHPHYEELQDAILASLPFDADAEALLVDAGGGSGRLAARFLERFPQARALVVDQSEAFLALAEERLAAFGGRGGCHVARLQSDWTSGLSSPPAAIVSMSAVHHLDAEEKRAFYRRAFEVLGPGGVLLNGDEVRSEGDAEYLALCREWGDHMRRVMDAGLIPQPMREALSAWQERNIDRCAAPRVSGDDCHETAAEQLGYLAECGFSLVDVPWQRGMWALLRGVK